MQDLLSQGAVTSDTVLYLVNAIYFGARRKFEFVQSKNLDEDFRVSNSETKQVKVLANVSDLNKNMVRCAFWDNLHVNLSSVLQRYSPFFLPFGCPIIYTDTNYQCSTQQCSTNNANSLKGTPCLTIIVSNE